MTEVDIMRGAHHDPPLDYELAADLIARILDTAGKARQEINAGVDGRWLSSLSNVVADAHLIVGLVGRCSDEDLAEIWDRLWMAGEVGRRFPATPLIDAVIARYGSLSAAGPSVARQLYRLRGSDLAVDQADRWACRAGFHPAEIWADWAILPAVTP